MGSEQGAQSYADNTPGARRHATGVHALQCRGVPGRADVAWRLVPPGEKGKQRKQKLFVE